jgi:hypothetical protein
MDSLDYTAKRRECWPLRRRLRSRQGQARIAACEGEEEEGEKMETKKQRGEHHM